MNIQISLLKRTGLSGLSKSDISDLKEEIKKLEAEVEKTNSKIEFWKREFKKRQPTKQCTKCGKPINLWPFEDDGYYIKGDTVTHIDCDVL